MKYNLISYLLFSIFLLFKSEISILNLLLNNEINSVILLLKTQNENCIINEATNEGWNPLLISSYLGNIELTELLLKNGAIIDKPGMDGWTPLMIACKEGHIEIVKLLLKYNANIHLISNNNVHVLSAAESSGSEEIISLINEAITKSSKSKLFLTSDNTVSLILTAAYSNSAESLLSTILEDNSNINERSIGQLTPLMLASSSGRNENIEILLSYNADINLQDHRGWTALMFAVQSNCLQCIETLLHHGARVDVINNSGHSASDIAERRGFPELGQEIYGIGYCQSIERHDLESIIEITKVGGNPNIQCANSMGYTPLIILVREGDDISIKYLLDSGADPNLNENDNWSPLMFGILRNSSHIVEMLLDYGASVNSITKQGDTPLSLLVKLKQLFLYSSSYNNNINNNNNININIDNDDDYLRSESVANSHIFNHNENNNHLNNNNYKVKNINYSNGNDNSYNYGINKEIEDMLRYASHLDIEQMMLSTRTFSSQYNQYKKDPTRNSSLAPVPIPTMVKLRSFLNFNYNNNMKQTPNIDIENSIIYQSSQLNESIYLSFINIINSIQWVFSTFLTNITHFHIQSHSSLRSPNITTSSSIWLYYGGNRSGMRFWIEEVWKFVS